MHMSGSIFLTDQDVTEARAREGSRWLQLGSVGVFASDEQFEAIRDAIDAYLVTRKQEAA